MFSLLRRVQRAVLNVRRAPIPAKLVSPIWFRYLYYARTGPNANQLPFSYTISDQAVFTPSCSAYPLSVYI